MGRRVYLCTFCGKGLASPSGLSNHQQLSRACRDEFEKLVASYNISTHDVVAEPEATASAAPNVEEAFEEDLGMTNHGMEASSVQYGADIETQREVAGEASRSRYKVTVEDADDDGELDETLAEKCRFVEPAPEELAAGAPISMEKRKTEFENTRNTNEKEGMSAWYPYHSEEEWRMAEWLVTTVGHNSIDDFLKLSIVSKFQ